MQLIPHIDATARRKQRDVLYLEFHPADRKALWSYRFEDDAAREQVIAWLDAHAIGWAPCGPYASVTRMESYRGQIYLDVPFDVGVPAYRELLEFLEHPDGSMKRPGVRFYAMSLAMAMENADHDAPGFWDRWADIF